MSYMSRLDVVVREEAPEIDVNNCKTFADFLDMIHELPDDEFERVKEAAAKEGVELGRF